MWEARTAGDSRPGLTFLHPNRSNQANGVLGKWDTGEWLGLCKKLMHVVWLWVIYV